MTSVSAVCYVFAGHVLLLSLPFSVGMEACSLAGKVVGCLLVVLPIKTQLVSTFWDN